MKEQLLITQSRGTWIILLIALLWPAGISAGEKLTYPFVFAPHEGLVNRTEKPFRQEICLNGFWEMQPVALPAGYTMGKGVAPELSLPHPDGWSATRIKIPSPWNINGFANNNLEGPDHRNYPSYPQEWEEVRMAWMKKKVTVPAGWTDKKVLLHFEAVAGYTEVYVNGRKAGENFDLFLPFEVDVTNMVQPGEEMEIWVGVRDQALFEDRSTIGRRVVPAGSMWGYMIRGIWQDVYLVGVPQIYVKDLYVKPLVSQQTLELEVTIENNSGRKEEVRLQGVINAWINKAGRDINSAPVPEWELGPDLMTVPASRLSIEPGKEITTTIRIPIHDGELDYWTPSHPNLYTIRLSLGNKKQIFDTKYERFGWREWTIQGTRQYLNGEPIELIGDSWHFMGIPQMTRRYAWAWYTAIKGMNGNAVRPHAQVYPRFYLDMADEMGICVLNETANWASDGGPKLDSEQFWHASLEHLERFVLRDRNHASVFGWSISNENKPVILHVYNRPELMAYQEKAWEDWRDIVMKHDPTRPWISADGEDDGDGILPVTVGHYGDMNSMKHWVEIGKPWGIGEHSMAYYGTPEQVAAYNRDEAYTSQYGRMKGLAHECYHLIANQRNMGASYVSVFNMAWYGMQPLPLGKKDLQTTPSLTEDGIFFTGYNEGVPGVQPERMGPYCTTFNPGYDPSLPLYTTWPMYDAMRAAAAPGGPAWSPYRDIEIEDKANSISQPLKKYKEVVFVGNPDSPFKQILDNQGVLFKNKVGSPGDALYIMDGTYIPAEAEKRMLTQHTAKGADVWIWGITPATTAIYNQLLPVPVSLEERNSSSFLPVNKSWMQGLTNADLYFCEIQQSEASQYGIAGTFAEQGEILLNACNTNWRTWNKRPEELKTAAVIRSENEKKGAAPVFVTYRQDCSAWYISTLTEFANSEKGYNTLAAILENAGIPCVKNTTPTADVFFVRDGRLQFPTGIRDQFTKEGSKETMTLWVFSPRPLDDLLIEPNMPKLTLFVGVGENELYLNDKPYGTRQSTKEGSMYQELPLLQGWNKIMFKINPQDKELFNGYFECTNNQAFLSLLQVRTHLPELR